MRWIITDDDIDGVACTRGTATKKRVGANAETVTPPRRTAMAASIFTIIILFLNDDVEENDSLTRLAKASKPQSGRHLVGAMGIKS
jgi:hypothetical protein